MVYSILYFLASTLVVFALAGIFVTRIRPTRTNFLVASGLNFATSIFCLVLILGYGASYTFAMVVFGIIGIMLLMQTPKA